MSKHVTRHGGPPPVDRSLAYPAFAFFWAFGAIAHNAKGGFITSFDVKILLSVAALAVMLRPASMSRMGVLLVVFFITIAIDLPFVTNHWMAYTLVNLGMVASLAVLRIEKGRTPTGKEWLTHFAPGVRLSVLVLYFWVTWHKLNPSFFDPIFSCATEMYGWLTQKLPILPSTQAVGHAPIVGTLLVEGGIPFLLLFKQTRILGVFVGLTFHALIGVNGFYDFSAVVMGLYVLFLGPDLDRGVDRLRADVPWFRAVTRRVGDLASHPATFPVLATLVVSVAVLPNLVGMDQALGQRLSRLGVMPLWLTITAISGWLLLILARREGLLCLGEGVRLIPTNAVSWALPALFVLNGLSPYLGLKTENSFAMFSNLQTSGRYWNHILMPRSLRVFPWQDRVVRIVNSSGPELARVSRDGTELVWQSFHQLALSHPDASVTYRINDGPIIHVPRIADDPDFATSHSWLLQKFVWFRPVLGPPHNYCTH